MKIKNIWYKKVYDKFLTELTLNSKNMVKGAEKEVSDLLRKLKLSKSANILDVPCGSGRHSRILAKKRFRVTGIDISKYNLSLARKATKSKNAKYIHGDMSKLSKYKGRFDCVLNLFTSIGYFETDRENYQVLKGIVDCLKPGGKLCMSLMNRDWLLGHFTKNEWVDYGQFYLLEEREFIRKKTYIRCKWIVIEKKTGKQGRYGLNLRVYSPSELKSLLRKSGLENVRAFGSFSGKKINLKNDRHAVYYAAKPSAVF
jgi:SAM-dependent methyltransferase